MVDLIKELYETCKMFESKLGDKIVKNEDLNDMSNLIENHLEKDFKKLVEGIKSYKKVAEIGPENVDIIQYAEAYHYLISGLAEMSSYMDDFHKIVFHLNRSFLYKSCEITLDEYQASDEIVLEDENDGETFGF